MDYYEKSKLEPGQEMGKAISNMLSCPSFRYSLYSGFTVDGREEVISRVTGEKEKGNTHIKGEMVNTPVDIYYIDRTIYNYDSFSQRWLVIESGTSNSEELLIAELNPLSNFRFKTVNQVEKLGFEKVNGVECLKVNCRPSIESQLLESLWKDFAYRLWIDYRKDRLIKAELSAVNQRNDKSHLKIRVEFSDFNETMNIKAPDRSSKK